MKRNSLFRKLDALGLPASLRGTAVALLVLSLAINLLYLTVPMFMLQVYDRVLVSQSVETLAVLAGLAIALLLAMAVLDHLRKQILSRVGAQIDICAGRKALAAFLENAGMDSTLQRRRALADANSLRQFVSGNGLVVLFDVPWVPAYLLVIFGMDPLLGWIATGAAALLLVCTLLSDLLTARAFERASGHAGSAGMVATTAFLNGEAVSAMGMAPDLTARWEREKEASLTDLLVTADRAGFIHSFAKFIRLGVQIAILAFGAWLVIEQTITAGVMIAASIIMGRALAPVEQLLGAWRGFLAARKALDTLGDFLAGVDARRERTTIPYRRGPWVLDRVGIVLGHTRAPILQNISLTIEPGEMIGIGGPNSAGKSTLARTLVGVISPTTGSVSVGGTEYPLLDRQDLGRHIGYLPQEIQILDGSVRDNIAQFRENDAEDVIAAARLAGAHDMILDLPDQYDTLIGPAGIRLSGGQLQRLGLARALYGSPDLILLDEPNANLDEPGERALANALNHLRQAKETAVVVVSHNPGLFTGCDRVCILFDGAIKFTGTPKEAFQQFLARRGAAEQPAPAPQSKPNPKYEISFGKPS